MKLSVAEIKKAIALLDENELLEVVEFATSLNKVKSWAEVVRSSRGAEIDRLRTNGMTYKAIGVMLNLSGTRCGQLHRTYLRRLESLARNLNQLQSLEAG